MKKASLTELKTTPRIIAAERLSAADLVITFDNGRSALYSASLLHDILPEAQELIDEVEFTDP